MPQLKVYKEGQLVQSLALSEGNVYIAGRASGSQIQLEPAPGISRHHFQIVLKDSIWQAQLLSRFGELYVGDEKVAVVDLSRKPEFALPPYEFVFEPENSSVTSSNSFTGSQSDRTVVAESQQQSSELRLVGDSGDVLQTYPLKGSSWIAGREPSCTVHLKESKVSRRQFEMHRERGRFFVRDLGSSNGTALNGRELSTENWEPIASGDVITVGDLRYQFMQSDAEFERRLQAVPEEVLDGSLDSNIAQDGGDGATRIVSYGQVAAPSATYFPPAGADGTSDPVGPFSASSGSAGSWQSGGAPAASPSPISKLRGLMNPVRVLLLIVLGVGGFLWWQSSQQGKQPVANEKAKVAANPFSQLSPEDQEVVRQAYSRGRELFQQGKYQLAKDEMSRVHGILPSGFEDSNSLATLAEQALENLAEIRRREEEEKQREQTERVVDETVALCQKEFRSGARRPDAIADCLAPASQLSPSHPKIMALLAEVEAKLQEILQKKERRSRINQQGAKQNALYSRVLKEIEGMKPRRAIERLETVTQSPWEDPQNTKDQARRKIAELRAQINKIMAEGLADFERLMSQGKTREAVLAGRQAWELDRSNTVLQKKIADALVDLTRQMQPIYQEAVVEESVGDLENAKKKWRSIMEKSVPGEEYFIKSRSKLRRHGAVGL